MGFLSNLIKKVKVSRLARPRVIRPADGSEITLKNASPETVEKVMKALAATQTEEEPQPTAETPVWAEKIEESGKTYPLSSTALGIYQDPLTLHWHLVTLKFSPFSKEAKVEMDMGCGREKYDAIEKFKIAAVNNNLVGG